MQITVVMDAGASSCEVSHVKYEYSLSGANARRARCPDSLEHRARRGSERADQNLLPSAFALSASNSPALMTPWSSSCLALAMSSAGEAEATCRM